jgi:AraC-like DNA-binding protein
MSESRSERDRINRSELALRIGSAVQSDGVAEPIGGLTLARASQPTERVFGVTRPCLCVIAQGAKELYLGDCRYRYDPDRYMIATVELPITGKVVEASARSPYLSLRLDLDPALVGSVMVESGLPAPQGRSDAKAVCISDLDSDLLEAVVRLMRLLDRPADARVLMPLVRREIVYRLLTGQQGVRLRHLPMLGGHSHSIARAVDRLRREFDRPLKIDHLARELGMSPSGFHHHFKAVTDMSPLQYQKRIRLQEARRLMLGESLDAASAGYRVGYDDPSHFSRDYKRLFGNSPIRDVERLRSMVTAD